jgi:glycosyltransferase involved in cell wall biosynthesis
MKHPELSIIIPVYNVESYLSACLTSICTANLDDIEVIVVDDGSTDGSSLIIDQFKRKYPTIITVRKENGGLSDARNFGLRIANGEFVIFVDSDDILHPEALSEMLYEAKRTNADIVVADYYEFSEEGKYCKKERHDKTVIDKPLIDEKERLQPLFLIDVSFAVWNKLYNRAFLDANCLQFLKGFWFEDLDFVFRAFYYANKVIKVNRTLYGYRQRTGSIMKSLSERMMDKLTIMGRIEELLKREGKFELYHKYYDILFLKMSFSIIYACLINKIDRNKSSLIIREILMNVQLKQIVAHKLRDYKELKIKEKVLFLIIKYNFFDFFVLTFRLINN